jgi:hypothetical protein
MSRHLTQDELIKCRFDLAEGAEALLIREHLDECPECRLEMEKLGAKLAALDELKEDIAVSEHLAARTVAGASQKQVTELRSRISKKQSDFGMPLWLQGVAAVLVAGILSYGAYILVNDAGHRASTQRKLASNELRDNKAGKLDVESQGRTLDTEAVTDKGRMPASGATAAALPPASPAVSAQEAEKPPFAPASAIELNVLPRRESVQLTIYNGADLTLVRESRKLTLKKGWNWLQFMWANTLIDPTSLAMEPMAGRDKIGMQQLVYPARLKDVGRWLIHSDIEGQVPFEITYFTSGVKWRAFYMGTLSQDESLMRLEGYVRVDNGSGEEYADARTRLVVGQVHQLDQIAALAKRPYPYGSPRETPDISGSWYERNRDGQKQIDLYASDSVVTDYAYFEAAARKPKEIIKEGLSEYFLYTIEGTETITDGWGKRLPSFAVDGVKVESLYKYDEQRWGTSTIRYVSFVNDEEHKLGQTPLPDGMVRIYGQAGDGNGLAYIGAAAVKYIPVNQNVELNLGATQEVIVEPKLMSFATENPKFGDNGDVTGWDEVRQWRLEVRNMRAVAAKVEIRRNFGTDYWKLDNAGDYGRYEKYDKTTARYTLDIAARANMTFTYTIRTYHGTRQEEAGK